MDDTSILPVVGTGAYGNVYAMGDHAIKEIEFNDPRDGPLIEMVIMRMELHPNIVKLVSASHTEKVIQLKMPLIPYTLNHMDADQLESMVDRIIDALAHLHQAGIMHCDVKPANILVNRDLEPFICDFSLSTISDEGHFMVCSSGFMPPEVVIGAKYDRSIDVWALGATILAVLNDDVSGTPDGLQDIIDVIGASHDEVDRFMAKYGIQGLEPRPSAIEGDTHLHVLARWMLMLNPDDRPSFKEMRQGLEMKDIKDAKDYIHDLDPKVMEALTSDVMHDGMWKASIDYI